MRPFSSLFLIMPLLELWVLIIVGQKIGALWTVGLVLLTTFLGLILLRWQGISTLKRAQQKMRSGETPAREIAEGMFLTMGGTLLVIPGFITDAIGFICLIPGVRRLLFGRLLRGFATIHNSNAAKTGGAEHDVIEGDFSRESDRGRENKKNIEPDK